MSKRVEQTTRRATANGENTGPGDRKAYTLNASRQRNDDARTRNHAKKTMTRNKGGLYKTPHGNDATTCRRKARRPPGGVNTCVRGYRGEGRWGEKGAGVRGRGLTWEWGGSCARLLRRRLQGMFGRGTFPREKRKGARTQPPTKTLS